MYKFDSPKENKEISFKNYSASLSELPESAPSLDQMKGFLEKLERFPDNLIYNMQNGDSI